MSMDLYISPYAVVHKEAILAQNVRIGPYANVGADVQIDARTTIGERSVIEADVRIGPDVRIGSAALILRGAQICPNKVRSVSSDGRTLGNRAIVGAGVLLHDEVELANNAIVPTQRTIAMIGNFGSKNRVVTIYGSDDGPRFSIGCQIGVNFQKIKCNVTESVSTTSASSSTYVPFLGVFEQIGNTVQAAYNKEAKLIKDLKAQRAANCT